MKLIPTIKQFFYLPLLCLACVTACKKPNEGIIIAFNTDLIKYQVLLQFQDAATSTTVPSGIKVNIYGGDAENVYNSGGKKSYSVAGDGTLNLGIDPKRTPIAGSPVSFYVQASANGYITQTQKVVISQGQTFKKVTVKLINAATPPKGYNVIQKTYTLTNGVLSKPAIAGFAMNENRTGSDIADNTTEENAMQKLAGLVISNLSKASFAGTFANTLTNIVNSSVNKGLLFRAPAPPADTAYYDNGNVSVVIPKGATFYYLKWVQTGTDTVENNVFNVTKPGKWVTDSTESIGSTTTTYKHYEPALGYYTKEQKIYPVGEYQRLPYTGNSMKITCITRPGQNTSLSLYPYDEFGTNVNTYKILNGQDVREDELLFSTAVKEKITDVQFSCKIDDIEYPLSPDTTVHWFSSLVLDKNFINPQTNEKIKEGDEIEVGIDPVTLQTVTMPVKLAANGELRVEEQFGDAGYYYKAPYTLSYTNTYTTDLDATLVPDMENVHANIKLTLAASVNFYYELSPNSGSLIMAGKISANIPVQNSSTVTDTYFGNNYVVTGTDAFGGIKLASLPPLVTFTLKAYCPKKDKILYPTYYGQYWMDSKGYIYFNVINGKWKTRGFAEGDKFSFAGYVGDAEIKQDVTVTGTDVPVDITSNSTNFCDIL